MQSRMGWLILTVLVAASLIVLAQIGRPDPRQRNFETITDMVYSPAYMAYEPNPVWHDTKTLQTPVDGAISAAHRPFPFGPDRDGFTTAEAEMRLAGEHWPMPDEFVANADADAEIFARGKKLFDTFCVVCHGKTGAGDGTLATYFPAVNFKLFERTATLNDGEIFYIVTRGGRGGIMASYATQISPDDRWRLIRYLRTVEPTPADTTPE